jgi:hypothetical protein
LDSCGFALGTGSILEEAKMKLSLGLMLLVVALLSCRDYDLEDRLVGQDGLVPADQYARYGREQAQAIAIAREFAQAYEGSAPDQLTRQAEAAATYARTLPDVADLKADPQGLVLTVRFKSGWRTMVTPLDDGKRGAETTGLPARTGTNAPR